MSLEVRGMFDDSLKYFANVISNNLRNEVQLIEVEEESTQIIARNYVCKYELEPEQKISSIEWIQRVSSSNNRKGRGKKRSAHPEDVNHNGLSLPVLAVLLNSTEVWLFTPGISQPTGKISTDFPISCISKSYNTENSLLVFDSEHNRLIEYSLDTLEQTKVISLKSKTSVKSVVGLASDKRKALLVGDHSVSLISLTNTKNPLITVFSKFEGTISHVHPSYDQQNKFIVSCQSSNKIYIVDISKPEEFQTIATTSSVKNLFIIKSSPSEEELIFAVLGDSIDVYVFEDDILHSIKISPSGSGDLIESIFIRNSTLHFLTYDINTPKFKSINWDFKSTEDLRIQVGSDITNIDLESTPQTSSILKKTKSENLTSSQLFSKLKLLLSSSNVDTEKVLDLCSSNNHENNVKETIQGFSSSEDASLGDKLFAIISDEVSLDPSENDSYAIWLKWLLLSYGGAYSKSSEMYGKVKTLHQSLSSGMKLMPSLLALQGRLLLLKTQTSFRNQKSSEDNQEYSYDEDIEESMNFANGENDESDIEDSFRNIEVGEEEVDEVDDYEEESLN